MDDVPVSDSMLVVSVVALRGFGVGFLLRRRGEKQTETNATSRLLSKRPAPFAPACLGACECVCVCVSVAILAPALEVESSPILGQSTAQHIPFAATWLT